MNWQLISHVARKEGLELLRDRRTLFVNIVLPVLLYPVLMLFTLQVLQLTRESDLDRPMIAVLTAPDELHHALLENPEKPRPFRILALDDEQQAFLRQALEDLATDPHGARASALAALRRFDLVAVLHAAPRPEGGWRLMLASDDAHRRHPLVMPSLLPILEGVSQRLLETELVQAGLPPSLAQPLLLNEMRLSPPAETMRARLAGIVPLLLVLMALSGAFYPALDLLAGERERGTLESLLCWPGERRDIFLGKLAVVVLAALVSVLLNLASLGLTAVIGISALPEGAAGLGGLAGGLQLGVGVLALCFLTLLPLVVTLAAVSLALAGLAASYKEAQNYLSPLFLLVMVPAFTTLIPTAAPSAALDLLPVVGPLLALKGALESPSIPWGHLLLSAAASTALAAVVVAWSVRLLDSERFLYPGLVRAGWGRWRRWGRGPAMPGGLEALGLFAACTGSFLLLGPQLARFGAVAQIVGPLLVGLALPTLLHAWLGAYDHRRCLGLAATTRAWWLGGLAAGALTILVSLGVGALQNQLLGPHPGLESGELQRLLDELHWLGGLPLLLLCLALAPGICEELLCRGTLLRGLRHNLGTTWALLISSFCFAALHADPLRFAPQLLAGLALGLLVLRSGSLLPAILAHSVHNGLLIAAPENVGQLFETLDLSQALLLIAVGGGGLWLLLDPRRVVARK